MTLQIGRFGQLPTVRSAQSWDAQGDRARVVVPIVNTSLAEVMALRHQAVGSIGDVVPVIWGQDPKVDGFYRVLDASVPLNSSAMRYDDLFVATFDLERVDAHSSPLFESQLIGTTLTNGLGITGKPFWSVPNATPLTFTDPEFGYTRLAEHPAGASTTMLMEFFTTFTQNPQWRPVPSQFYAGSCRVEQEISSGVWVPVTGRKQSLPDNGFGGIRINNGLVRCRVASNGADLSLAVDHWKNSSLSWNAKQYSVRSVTGGGFVVPIPNAITIIRNDPETVVIRTASRLTEDPNIEIYLSVRRGDRWVRGQVSGKDSTAWAVRRLTAEASDGVTGGLHATANDADGNRFMLASAVMTTKDGALGQQALPSAAASADFGIGTEIGGTTSDPPDEVTGTRNMIEQYFAAQYERQTLVGQ